MSLSRLVVFVICWFAHTGIAAGQGSPLFKFDHPLADFVLPSESFTTLYQDHKGIIWAGTTVGLVRYDGKTVEVYLHIPGDTTSLSSRHINAITEHGGELWIATKNGLNRFDANTNTFERFLDNPLNPPQR